MRWFLVLVRSEAVLVIVQSQGSDYDYAHDTSQ
jgi:hypothetical protein